MDWPNTVPSNVIERVGIGIARKYRIIPISLRVDHGKESLVVVTKSTDGLEEVSETLSYLLNAQVEVRRLEEFNNVEESQFNDVFDTYYGGEVETVVCRPVSTLATVVLYFDHNEERAENVESKLLDSRHESAVAKKMLRTDSKLDGIDYAEARRSIGTILIAHDFCDDLHDFIDELSTKTDSNIYVVFDDEFQEAQFESSKIEGTRRFSNISFLDQKLCPESVN